MQTLASQIPSPKAYAEEPVRFPQLQPVDLIAEGHASTGVYRNIVVNQINKHCLRLSTFEGEYPWHYHPHSDELFLILEGHLHIDFADHPTVRLDPGQILTVPAGTVHRTRTDSRVINACFEELGAATEFVPPPETWLG